MMLTTVPAGSLLLIPLGISTTSHSRLERDWFIRAHRQLTSQRIERRVVSHSVDTACLLRARRAACARRAWRT